MGTFSLVNPTIFVHDLDMSGYLNKVTVKTEAAELDVTNFASGGSVQRIGGLKTTAMDSAGFWDSTPDLAVFSALGVADRVVTVSSQGAETNTAYMFQSGRFTYEMLGAIGDAAPFAMSSMNTNSQGLVRGQIAKAKGNVSGTGQVGSILTMTGPTASQFLYATIHVFSAGTSATIQVQSATTLGFAGPTTRGSFTLGATAGGSWLVRVAGSITDGFWRLNASAISGTYSLGGAIGVGS